VYTPIHSDEGGFVYFLTFRLIHDAADISINHRAQGFACIVNQQQPESKLLANQTAKQTESKQTTE